MLREHINFPSYKFRLGMTIAMRSDIVLQLGDEYGAASMMVDALSIMADACHTPVNALSITSEFILAYIRDRDAKYNAKWRQSSQSQ